MSLYVRCFLELEGFQGKTLALLNTHICTVSSTKNVHRYVLFIKHLYMFEMMKAHQTESSLTKQYANVKASTRVMVF